VHIVSHYTDCLVRYSENCSKFCPVPGGTASFSILYRSVGTWH